MLRLFLWRITFEFLELLHFFNFKWGYDHYFAYGANLAPQVLERRKMTPVKEFFYTLQDYELVFDQKGAYKDFGFASIAKKNQSYVVGKIYKLSR